MYALFKTFLSAYKRTRQAEPVINDVPFAVRMIFKAIVRCMETELMESIDSEINAHIEIAISTATNTDKIHYSIHGVLGDIEMSGDGWIAQPEFTFEVVTFEGQHYVKGTFDTAVAMLRTLKIEPVGK